MLNSDVWLYICMFLVIFVEYCDRQEQKNSPNSINMDAKSGELR